MKKGLIFGIVVVVIVCVVWFANQSKNGGSVFGGAEDSCHTCFTLKGGDTQAAAKKSENHFFAKEDGVKVFDSEGKNTIGSTIKGFGGEEVKQIGDKVVLKVKGYKKDGDTQVLYGDSEFMLPVITLSSGSVDSDTLEVALLKQDVLRDSGAIWSENEFVYYDNCSMCHAAHAPDEHTIQEWEGIYGTMRAFAMPTEANDKLIWQYLQAHAKESFALEE